MDYQAHYRPAVPESSERSFGFLFASVFLAVGLWPAFSGQAVYAGLIAIAAGFAVCGLVIPSVLRPLKRLWLRFGALMHRITSPILLGAVFYLVIWPTGLVLRRLGKDPLRLRLDRAMDSYWIRRQPPGPTPESLHHPF
jgi:hypothetical protein